MSVSLRMSIKWMTLSAALLFTLAVGIACGCEGAPPLFVQNFLPTAVDVYVVIKLTEVEPATEIAQSEWGKPERRVSAGTDVDVSMLEELCEAVYEGKERWVYVRAVEVGGQGRTYLTTRADRNGKRGIYSLILDESGFR